MTEWLGEPAVRVETASTTIEQDFESGTGRGWESIRVAVEEHFGDTMIVLTQRGDGYLSLPVHQARLVHEALGRALAQTPA